MPARLRHWRGPYVVVTRALVVVCGVALGASLARADDLKVALIYGRTGPLEAYAKQTETGFRMGLEYATKGSMEVGGRKIVIITKDDQGKPDLAKTALTEAYEDDGAEIAIGTTSSPATIAMLPVAEEHKKILIVEPAVADQITGEKWNRYIFRTARNSTQDAISNAVAIGAPGVQIGVLAVDNAFGRDGVAAFKGALAKTGATLAAEEYAPATTTDFTAVGQRLFDALEGQAGQEADLVHLGGRRQSARQARRHGPRPLRHRLRGGRQHPAGARLLQALPGPRGRRRTTTTESRRTRSTIGWSPSIRSASTRRRISSPAAASRRRWRWSPRSRRPGSTDAEKLIPAMEGLEFDTPKGKMIFRKEDHQALQSMFAFKIKVDPNVAWGVPELTKELKIEDMDIPIRNKR